MKKPYTAPFLLAESFLTTEHIASCDVFGKPNSGSQDVCTYTFDVPGGEIELFLADGDVCIYSSDMVEDYIGSGQLLIGS